MPFLTVEPGAGNARAATRVGSVSASGLMGPFGSSSPLLPVAVTFLAALGVLGLSRVGLMIWYWPRVEAAGRPWYILLQGLRFDLVLMGWLFAVPAALTCLVAIDTRLLRLWQPLLRAYLACCLAWIVFMETATPSFVNEYDARPNVLFIEYLRYPKEVLRTLWFAYKFQLLVGIVLTFLLGYGTLGVLRRAGRTTRTLRWPAALLLVLLMLVAGFAMARSTWDHRPVNPSTVAFSPDPLVNDLALNSPYTVLFAGYEASYDTAGGIPYGTLPADVVIERVRAELHLDGDNPFVEPALPTLHPQHPTRERERPLNLVIVLEESLGAEFVECLGGLPLTPNLCRLRHEALWFENLYATGTRSVRGLEAVVAGFTPTPAQSVVKLPGAQRGFFTLAQLLSRQGYDTSFIYGGEAHFDNMRRFFMGNGFATVIDENDYPAPKFRGTWGVSDEDLFAGAHEYFEARGDEPFFSLVFTSSNHSPFQFPDGGFELYDRDKQTVNNAVKYADHALGKFFEQARRSGYWKDTVFLVVADHNSRVYGPSLVPVERFHVPALVLGPGIAPATFEPVASQIDLAPTLLSLIGVGGVHPMIGRDLTRPIFQHIPGRAILQFGSRQAYLEDDRLVVLERDAPPSQYRLRDGGLEPVEQPDHHLLETALAHSLWSSMAYRDHLYRLPEADDLVTRIASQRPEPSRRTPQVLATLSR